ncbi:putative aminoacyl-tRNA hydrolase [Sinorhizobium phage phiN3]|uniref:peptidyl-tRNA hydrolase n=1 Tax=Sinorhizobium phage phiN3 TaxID=1647405 RepID=A0A0F6WCM5_9CAUD|nr:putative aminoacyl-tRNA hydrolase [Sinorhizobium phage phiN3]AKF13490.1 putative aminoacyl-tRNA hydrolase [Sinorhizobium phage phiN3]
MPMPNGMPILYILMRTDLASLNPGKMAAQASHAANMSVGSGRKDAPNLVYAWERETPSHCGTTIVLDGGSMENINDIINEIAVKNFGSDAEFSYGIWHDPSYPLRDGNFTHLIPLDVCGWVFTRAGDPAQQVLSTLELHP